jgi:hypothetical protein
MLKSFPNTPAVNPAPIELFCPFQSFHRSKRSSDRPRYWFWSLIVYLIVGVSPCANAQMTFSTGPTVVNVWLADGSSQPVASCSNNICTWPLTHTIARGHTMVGYVHAANQADNTPMYPQSIKAQNGTSLNITPAAEWTPFHEDIVVWYLQNVRETITSLTFDLTQYNRQGAFIGTSLDTAFVEYSNVDSLTIVNPSASNSTTPSLTITPTSSALIWVFGSFFVPITDGSITTSGYSTLINDQGNNIAVWGSNGLVPAFSQTLTFSNPVGPPGTCASWAPNGCSAVLAAVALQGRARSPR